MHEKHRPSPSKPVMVSDVPASKNNYDCFTDLSDIFENYNPIFQERSEKRSREVPEKGKDVAQPEFSLDEWMEILFSQFYGDDENDGGGVGGLV